MRYGGRDPAHQRYTIAYENNIPHFSSHNLIYIYTFGITRHSYFRDKTKSFVPHTKRISGLSVVPEAAVAFAAAEQLAPGALLSWASQGRCQRWGRKAVVPRGEGRTFPPAAVAADRR